MTLREIDLKGTLSSEDRHLLEEFYVPALRESVGYKRAVGYFSAHMLCHAAQGLSALYENSGTCQLIIGNPLADDEYQAVRDGYGRRALYDRIADTLSQSLQDADHPLYRNRLALLGALVARGLLEIRFAYRTWGMYHDKAGLFEDVEGNKVAFSGSANETVAALLPENNVESIFVYPNWNREIYTLYGQEIEQRLDRLWQGTARNTTTVECPSEVYEILASQKEKSSTSVKNELTLSNEALTTTETDDWPVVPSYFGGNEYRLRYHQEEALSAWKAHDFAGMFAHATGAGKTVTALHAATRLAEYHRSIGRNFFVVVAVPYQVLADQWMSVMTVFNCKPVGCFGTRRNWQTKMDQEISDAYIAKSPVFCGMVVVNRTLTSEYFQRQVERVSPADLMFVGDECHHHGSARLNQSLPDARYRLGLSATPYSQRETERADVLRGYYGPIVSEYGIDEALRDRVLTRYEYYPYQVRLDEDETETYEALSNEIAQYLDDDGSPRSDAGKDRLNALFGQRARLLGSAGEKFRRLSSLVEEIGRRRNTLFYCGDGSTELDSEEGGARDIERTARILAQAGWKTSRITAQENRAQRAEALENFRLGYIDAVVAIRVLDEGFDMPDCRTAFLLASSRNPRQYIQRRGRILRRAPGKKCAQIIDFIVTPAKGHRTSAGTRLVENELLRAAEFTRAASNRESAAAFLCEIGRPYGLDYEDLERDVALSGVTD